MVRIDLSAARLVFMTDAACSNCEHWKPTALGSTMGIGECRAILHKDESAEDARAWIEPGEVCDVDLVTRADFGCAMHEPRV